MGTTRVKMIATTNGAPGDGNTVYEYEADKVYDVPEELGAVFVQWGYAEAYEGEDESATPGGVEIVDAEAEARAQAAADGHLQPPKSLAHVDPDHYPAQAEAIAQAKADDAAAAGGKAVPVGADLPKSATRAQLDAAAKAIGLDTSNLPNKTAVREAIAEAQGGNQ